jgi:hypothetical protein
MPNVDNIDQKDFGKDEILTPDKLRIIEKLLTGILSDEINMARSNEKLYLPPTSTRLGIKFEDDEINRNWMTYLNFGMYEKRFFHVSSNKLVGTHIDFLASLYDLKQGNWQCSGIEIENVDLPLQFIKNGSSIHEVVKERIDPNFVSNLVDQFRERTGEVEISDQDKEKLLMYGHLERFKAESLFHDFRKNPDNFLNIFQGERVIPIDRLMTLEEGQEYFSTMAEIFADTESGAIVRVGVPGYGSDRVLKVVSDDRIIDERYNPQGMVLIGDEGSEGTARKHSLIPVLDKSGDHWAWVVLEEVATFRWDKQEKISHFINGITDIVDFEVWKKNRI